MARFENGWIKIHRSILDNAVAKRDLFTLGVFVRILCMANWKESQTVVSRQKVVLKPGQIATGLRELSPDRDEDPYLHRVRNALAYLEICETIEQATSNHGRIITIRNWEKYQATDDEASKQGVSEAQTVRKQSASRAQHSEEGKKVRKKEIDISLAFEEAWKRYPSKDGKRAAARSFLATVKTEEDIAAVHRAMDNYLGSPAVLKGFVKNGSTWFNNWRDWVEFRGLAAVNGPGGTVTQIPVRTPEEQAELDAFDKQMAALEAERKARSAV